MELELGQTINLTGARVDVSSLDAEDKIMASISSTAPTGLIPISQSRRGTVSTLVAEVEARPDRWNLGSQPAHL